MRRSESHYNKVLSYMQRQIGPDAESIMDRVVRNIERQMTRAYYTAYDTDKADAVYGTFMELDEGMKDLAWRFNFRSSQTAADWLCANYGFGIDAGLNNAFEGLLFRSKKTSDESARLELVSTDKWGELLLETYLDGLYLGVTPRPGNYPITTGKVYSFQKSLFIPEKRRKLGIEITL